MQTFIDAEGNSYPVSDRTLIDFPDGWTYDETRTAMARWGGGVVLTERERAWLVAQTNRTNMQNIVNFLAGRDFRDVGPTLDCVHGQRWSPDTCDCVHDELFHHFDKGEPKEHRIHKSCLHHEHLKAPEAHRAALLDETSHRSKVRALVAEHLGVDQSEVEATFNAARELHVDHPKLRESDGKGLQAKLTKEFAGRKVHLP